ncbi:hypothetical protein HOLleu_10599 [Holothuria leucospilota]|uniref:ATP-dependent DNA helicase n=1 Tax=Holothuria leucospilota TaxID=206669 RepID=A0A9Q1CE98_HOLLE|nr:hypothetical protein HOLleu_10599 [Holothuria leucospilota]
MKQDQVTPLLQTLNKDQRQLFNHIHKHCKDKVHDPQIRPFHIFLTGGAGTGKSQLIKCIRHGCVKVLLTFAENPENVTVLPVAYTGTAAYNIGGKPFIQLSVFTTPQCLKTTG